MTGDCLEDTTELCLSAPAAGCAASSDFLLYSGGLSCLLLSDERDGDRFIEWRDFSLLGLCVFIDPAGDAGLSALCSWRDDVWYLGSFSISSVEYFSRWCGVLGTEG